MAEQPLPSAESVARLNRLSVAEAHAALSRCCGASTWIAKMLARRPFSSAADLFDNAEAAWRGLSLADYLEAFAHHPEIGADLNELRKRFAGTAELSLREQAGATEASDATLRELRAQNRAYRQRFGYSFIVCATGKTAEEMLTILQQRLASEPEPELLTAAAEQAKITRLRLEKI